MSRRLLVCAVTSAALIVAGPAAAAQSGTVTATGVQLVRVVPRDRHSNASIQAAVEAAQSGGVPGALRAAHANALRYAAAAGLTLGALTAVTDVSSNGAYFAYGPFEGPFGINRYCGTERRPVFKTVDKKRKLVRFRKVHTCIVPQSEATTLSVTYATT
jgi:hypothetical protein